MLLLLLAIAAATGAQVTEPAEIDLRAFVEIVDRIGRDLERPDVDARALADVLASIPTRLRVKIDDQHFDVSFEPLAALIATGRRDPSQWPQRRLAIRQQLLTIRNEATSMLIAPASAQGDPRPALTAILARREFVRAAPTDWTSRLRRRAGEWLLGLWNRVGGNRLDTDRAARVLVWVSTLAALVALVVWLRRNVRRRIATTREVAPAQAVPTAARERALQVLAAIRAGHAADAVRLAYRAAVTRLAELGVWRVDESRTAREYLTLLSGGEDRERAFRGIAAQFEHVAYANRAATADDLDRLIDHLETLGCVRPHERAI